MEGKEKEPQLKTYIIDESAEGFRLDIFVRENYPLFSRTKTQLYINRGHILVNNEKVKKRALLKKGDQVEVDESVLKMETGRGLEPWDLDLEVLYEDEHFVAINKPSGVIVHPGNGKYTGTLVNALVYHFKKLSKGGDEHRPGIVHRLDKYTTGVILVAKTDSVHDAFGEMFYRRLIQKTYVAICIGQRPSQSGVINEPMGRCKNDPIRCCVRADGKDAITEYDLVAHKCGISVLKLHPKTGRTHQIRVHCSYCGFPIAKDIPYGGDKKKALTIEPLERPFAYKILKCFPHQALHARKINFIHPVTQEDVTISAPYPEDFCKAIEFFGEDLSLETMNAI